MKQKDVDCEDIVSSDQCNPDIYSALGLKCLLEISENPICRGVVNNCEDITRSKISCEAKGAAINSSSSSSSDEELKCIWLEGNISSGVGSRCALQV
jgi:hypothetical protein